MARNNRSQRFSRVSMPTPSSCSGCTGGRDQRPSVRRGRSAARNRLTRHPPGAVRIEGEASDRPIIERSLDRSHDLIVLVPLARDEHDVARGRALDGGLDRRAPIGDERRRSAPLVRHAGVRLVDDGLRIFRARVVRRDDHLVRVAPGGAGHARPLGAIAVAAAAEDHPQPPARRNDRPQRGQDVLERVIGVGVVDEHRERSRPDRSPAPVDPAARRSRPGRRADRPSGHPAGRPRPPPAARS